VFLYFRGVEDEIRGEVDLFAQSKKFISTKTGRRHRRNSNYKVSVSGFVNY